MSTIVHEAEVQRQHTRYRIPVMVRIGESEYRVLDWSISGFAVEVPQATVAQGKNVPIVLTFPFDSFGLDVKGDAEVVYFDKGRAGFRFVNVSQRFTSLIRFVIDAYLSGEIVNTGDLLEVCARAQSNKPRSGKSVQELSTSEKVRRAFGTTVRFGVVAAASLLLGVFVYGTVKERLFYVPANAAVITTDLAMISAPTSGTLSYISTDEKVSRGDPIAALNTLEGKQVFVSSPCDCDNYLAYAEIGDFVSFGTPLMALRREDSKPYISALVEPERAVKILSGAVAHVRLPDGSKLESGDLKFIPASERSDGSTMMKVVFPIAEDVAASRIGQPVTMYFDTTASFALADKLPGSLSERLTAMLP